MAEVGAWIRAADAKATILIAAAGVVLAAISIRADTITRALHHRGCARYYFLAPSLALGLISLVLVGRSLYNVLVPRTTTSKQETHFSWSTISKKDHPPRPSSQVALAEEAWIQAFDLSKIADAKYSAFKSALRRFAVLVGAALLIVGFATWIVNGSAAPTPGK